MQGKTQEVLKIVSDMVIRKVSPTNGWLPLCQTIFYQPKRPKQK